MSHPDDTVTISWERSMQAFDPLEWNAMAAGTTPFMRWEWLDLLERSGSVRPETGWLPLHCAVRDEAGLAGAAPLYAKGHGEGEFVYDRLWADLARQLDIAYYPKLVAASPFTPVRGYSFLSRPSFPRRAALCHSMLSGMLQLAQSNDFSGLHVLFTQDGFGDLLEQWGMTAWEHQGFIWENPGYGDFEDFLAAMRSGARNTIRKERKRLAASGVKVEVVEGTQAPEEWFGLMHHYYEDTNDKFGEWGCKYLTREFFLGLADCFRERLAFSAAFEPGRKDPVGLALLIHDEDALYGRYWGAAREIPFLHFELCYYAPMEWAISRRIARYDPGMGGEHKPRRGFRSLTTRSMHRYIDPVLAKVFTRHIPQLNAIAQEHIQHLEAMCPFKRP